RSPPVGQHQDHFWHLLSASIHKQVGCSSTDSSLKKSFALFRESKRRALFRKVKSLAISNSQHENPKTCLSRLLRQAAAIEQILAQRIPPWPISAWHHCRSSAGGGISKNGNRRFCMDCARSIPRSRTGKKRR